MANFMLLSRGKKRSNTKELDELRIQNYNKIINYFTWKEKAFIQFIEKEEQRQLESTVKSIEEGMNELITKLWGKINDTILSLVDIDKAHYREGRYSIKKDVNLSLVNLPEHIKDKIISGLNGKGNIYSMLGFFYEDWLHELFTNGANEVVEKTSLSLLKGLIDKSGDKKSASSLRGINKDIRPDLLIYNPAETSLLKNGDVLQAINNNTGNGIDIELLSIVDIDMLPNVENGLIIESTLLNKYLNNNIYGFSVKRWTSSDMSGKLLTSASGLQLMLNKAFLSSGPRTWDANYAYHFMLYKISTVLLDILGPINIAFITGNKIEWMSQFLQDYMLYMHLYSEKEVENNEIVSPHIYSGNVYIRKLLAGNFHATVSSHTKFSSKKYGDSFRINYTLKHIPKDKT